MEPQMPSMDGVDAIRNIRREPEVDVGMLRVSEDAIVAHSTSILERLDAKDRMRSRTRSSGDCCLRWRSRCGVARDDARS
ncbi:MAG TPA: hypothetical protein VFS55_15310 [Dokdonella sp.]|nr:hypothetical protein [Dokdonella sp.]